MVGLHSSYGGSDRDVALPGKAMLSLVSHRAGFSHFNETAMAQCMAHARRLFPTLVIPIRK